MKNPIRWMAGNHVAANLLMLIFIIGGVVLGSSVKQEVFPEIDLDMIQVSVAYPGADPEEVEEGILLKIEENVSGVNGIKEIKSTAAEGFGVVTIEVLPGEDSDQVLQDVKAEVDRIFTFPEEAEKPITTKLTRRQEVISLVIFGDVPERNLREQAEIIRDELLALPEITQVELGGVRPYEISIEIAEGNLRRYNLTLDQVARRVRQASLDLPGGTIKAEGGEILLRTKERRYLGSEYGDITLIQNPDGTEVKLGQVATIRDTFRDTDEFARFDGKPAAMVAVFRVGDQKPTVISDVVEAYIERKGRNLPPSIKLASWNDTSELFESRMNLLLRNAGLGLILVLLVLGLFLQLRLALWVMLGIPISFLGALLLMPLAGVSINMISLFAFILALGIVVDDAIVVGENIFEHRQRGKPRWRAAVDGATEVAGPVVFSILTTVAAFLPLLFVSGNMGKFIKVIPAVVITILLVSLVESLFVLPAHLSLGEDKNGKPGRLERFRNRFGDRLQRFIHGPYRRLLDLCLRFRYSTVAAAVALLLLCVGMVAGGVIKFRFMPEVDGDVITATLQMPVGTPVAETSRIVERMVASGQEVIATYDLQLPAGGTALRHIYAAVGSKIIKMAGETSGGGHLAEVALLLTPSEKRGIPAAEIAKAWRNEVGEVPGADSLVFTSDLMRFGANIDIQLAHNDFRVLEQAAAQVKGALGEYPGVGDIADTYNRGKRELKVRLTPEARTLGITEEDLGRQIRAAFFGAEALRLQRGRNEVKVMVRYPEEDRQGRAHFEAMRIRTPTGGEIPLAGAATVEEGRGFSTINRTDRKRVLNVTASVDKTANPGEILADLKTSALAGLAIDYPGLTFDLEGEQKEQRQSFGSMRKGFLLALFLIFALLAIPFGSYSQPLIIMTAIPFGVVGAILGHFIMGYNLSILSIFGIVALSGVVVNNSLLLIDYINRRQLESGDTHQSVMDAGIRRFRPILLTSLTTFFGLAPMILERSVQAQFLIPMAISLGFGVLFATGITLLLIPCLYLVLDDIKKKLGMRSFHEALTEKAAMERQVDGQPARRMGVEQPVN
jgi:multidrug efflux pump subunit AcrB